MTSITGRLIAIGALAPGRGSARGQPDSCRTPRRAGTSRTPRRDRPGRDRRTQRRPHPLPLRRLLDRQHNHQRHRVLGDIRRHRARPGRQRRLPVPARHDVRLDRAATPDDEYAVRSRRAPIMPSPSW